MVWLIFRQRMWTKRSNMEFVLLGKSFQKLFIIKDVRVAFSIKILNRSDAMENLYRQRNVPANYTQRRNNFLHFQTIRSCRYQSLVPSTRNGVLQHKQHSSPFKICQCVTTKTVSKMLTDSVYQFYVYHADGRVRVYHLRTENECSYLRS